MENIKRWKHFSALWKTKISKSRKWLIHLMRLRCENKIQTWIQCCVFGCAVSMCTVQSVLYIKKAADDDDDEEDEEGWSMISNVYIKTVNTHSPPLPPSAWNETHLNWKTFVVINTRFFTIKWAYFHGVYTLDDAIFFIAYALFGFYPHFYYFKHQSLRHNRALLKLVSSWSLILF